MKVGELFYTTKRGEWRKWLQKNHHKKKEIWLVFYRKSSGKPRISYDKAVEEALCFGWIDSIVKGIDQECFAQRFSPRKPGSVLSQLNRERIRNLLAKKKMTKFGLASVAHVYNPADNQSDNFTIPSDILKEIKKSGRAWKNFEALPARYKRIRISWIDGARKRPEEFKKRLNYFIKMTAEGKRFGMLTE